MCLIIFTPNISRARIREDILEKGFDKNSDGAGFAYIEDGKVKISKAYFAFEDFIRNFRRVKSRLTDSPILIHFRWSTCGSHNYTNTQPICVHKHKFVMAHNGVFSGLSGHKDDISDSVYLSQIVKGLGWTLPLNRAQVNLLEGLCDNYSKLVFLDNSGNYQIVNECLGRWKYGAWYSDKGDVFKKEFSYKGRVKVCKDKRYRAIKDAVQNNNSGYNYDKESCPNPPTPPDNDFKSGPHVNSSFGRGCAVIAARRIPQNRLDTSRVIGPYASSAPDWRNYTGD